MTIRLDHVVLWVADPLRSVEFYERVLGLDGLRIDEFRAGEALFPSVRVSADTILDLMPMQLAPRLAADHDAPGSAGNQLNHLCLAMDRAAYRALQARLETHGVPVRATLEHSFGARGFAPETLYITDLDGNVIEARYYDE